MRTRYRKIYEVPLKIKNAAKQRHPINCNLYWVDDLKKIIIEN